MEIEFKQHVIKIVQDMNPQSPDDWGNEGAFLVYDHKDFTVKRDGFEPRDIFRNIEDYLKDYYVFVVYAYIHSGIVLSLGDGAYPFNDRWDVSSTGYFLVSRNGVNTDRAQLWAENILEEWNSYLSGNVYGYEIYFNNEFIDSCWGFYGEESFALNEAKDLIECKIKYNPEKYAVQLTLNL